jgi:hypothetical protein
MPVKAIRSFIQRWPGTIIFVLVSVMVVVGIGVDQHQNDISCRRQSENREVIREVVRIATEPGGTFNFDSIPEFQEVDPQTQAYLIALGEALESRGRAGDTRQRLLAAIPTVNC